MSRPSGGYPAQGEPVAQLPQVPTGPAPGARSGNLPAGVSATFVYPCLTCGVTVRVVDAVVQPHDCVLPDELSELIARAWWNGRDSLDVRTAPFADLARAAFDPDFPTGSGEGPES